MAWYRDFLADLGLNKTVGDFAQELDAVEARDKQTYLHQVAISGFHRMDPEVVDWTIGHGAALTNDDLHYLWVIWGRLGASHPYETYRRIKDSVQGAIQSRVSTKRKTNL